MGAVYIVYTYTSTHLAPLTHRCVSFWGKSAATAPIALTQLMRPGCPRLEAVQLALFKAVERKKQGAR
eukprot:1160364-Pelagomonas_calceolata.AAC.3